MTTLIWSVNQSIFAQLEVLDSPMFAFNTLTLAVVGFVPFLSSILSEYSFSNVADQQVATQFSMAIIFAGSSLQVCLIICFE